MIPSTMQESTLKPIIDIAEHIRLCLVDSGLKLPTGALVVLFLSFSMGGNHA